MHPLFRFRSAPLFIAVALLPTVAKGEEYRPLPLLKVEPDTVRPLSLGFTARSVIPWFGPGEPPAILIANHGKYFPQRTQFYRADGKITKPKAFSVPTGYPLYKEVPLPREDSLDESGHIQLGAYMTIMRADGLFDLVKMGKKEFFSQGTMEYYRNIGKPGTPVFEAPYNIVMADPPKVGTHWIADVNGDGIPDLLSGGLQADGERFKMYPDYPAEQGPWSGKEHPNMGSLPDTDIQSFRGYDIAGNWMGLPVRKYLWWAKGSLGKDGRLRFGHYRHVRYGETDYPVQWQNFSTHMSPAVMNLDNGPHIILVSGPDEVLALPLRGERNGELRTGKAFPFLKGGAKLKTANLPIVIGVGDMNGNGRQDLIIGSGANGRMTVLSGTKAGEFEEMGNIFSKGGAVAGDTLTTLVRKDWDGDGYPDLILGDASGILSFWKGTGDPTTYASCDFFHTVDGPVRHRPTGGNLQGEVEAAWSYIQPEVFDWDGDGKPDIITNDNEGKLFLYRGTGPSTLLKQRERFTFEGKPLAAAWRSRPAVVDGKYHLAGDDRPCLLFMTWDRKLAFAVPKKKGSIEFERVQELFYNDGDSIVLSGPAGLSGRVTFSVVDWDGDGKWDLVTGVQSSLQKYFRLPGTESPSAAPYWLRNTGTNEKPSFDSPRMITFDDGMPIRVSGHSFNVYPTNLGSGQPDIIFGDDEGFIFYLMRNQLAWNEPVEEMEKARVRERERKEKMSRIKQGVLFEDIWNYPVGKLDAVNNEGTGWEKPWQAEGPYAAIPSRRFSVKGIFATEPPPSCVELSGKAEGAMRLRRPLAQPFSLAQKNPITLTFSTRWARVDNADNKGHEAVQLLGLCDSQGKALIALGTNSEEFLEVRIGGHVFKAPYEGQSFNGSWAMRAEIELRPAGMPVAVRVKVSPAPIDGKVESWDIDVEEPLEGLVEEVSVSVEKYAGDLQVGPIRLEAR